MDFEKRIPVPVYEYQRRWVKDKSRFKIGLMARQTGKSFSTSLEAVLDCYRGTTKWVFLSAGERQSKELMMTAATHARAIGLAVEEIEGGFRDADTEYKQLEIRVPNGSRIIGLPANPATARGHSANVLLDEFAFHKDSREIWKALFPTITRGYKIRIISTPQGRQNKFYELWSGNPQYSKHKITIHDAFSQGLELYNEDGTPMSAETLREALGDEDAWQQEYLCEFLDEATAWLTYKLIGECEHIKAGLKEESSDGARYMGIDIGRKKDLTVLWDLEQVGDVLWTRDVMVMERLPFSVQEEIIFDRIETVRPHRACFDSSGLGMQMAERAQERFGTYMIEAVQFTNKVKEDLSVTLKSHFEDKRVRIPIDKKIREDLHAVKKVTTSAGNIRFDAERTEDGHSDRYWALALAAHAGSGPAAPIAYEAVSKRESMAGLGRGAW